MTDQSPEATDVKRVLERGFGTEPPVRVTRDDLIARGRRRQRRQRAAAVGGVTLAAAAVLTVVSITTSGLTSSAPIGPASGSGTRVEPMPTAPPSVKDRMGEALRTAPIAWPAEITGRTSETGPDWYSFRYGFVPTANATGYEATVKLHTDSGFRWLSIDVVSVNATEHAPECVGAQSKQPLPNCTRTTLPDGGEMRVDVEEAASDAYPTIALVTVVRPDHTKIEVMETSSVGDGSRSAQLLPTPALVQLAQLPGLASG